MPAWPRKASYDNKGRVPLYMVGVDTIKDTIAARLGITEPGPGYIHFGGDLGPDYFAQLTSEKRVTRFVRGRAQRTWQPMRDGMRNEALDSFVYALAALSGLQMAGLRLEVQIARLNGEIPVVTPARPSRTVIRSPYMGAR